MTVKRKLTNNKKAINEIEHGKLLAAGDAEASWGWETAAGRQRAIRRGQLLAAAANLAPGVRVLELGCGTGLFTRIFAETGASITAIDISPELLTIAERRTKDVNFICGRFEETEFPREFDVVIGSSVLHHLDLLPALNKSISVLRPGGVFAFAEPNFMNPQIFAERNFLRGLLPHVSPDETAFSRWQLKGILEQVGFERIRIRPFDWLHPSTPVWAIRFIAGLGRILEGTPVLREFAGSLLIRCENRGSSM